MPVHEFTVEDLKVRLDRYLANQLSSISRSKVQRDIEGGYVDVNGQPITESKFVVRKGDTIVYREPEVSADELAIPSTPLKVLYHEHGLLIIDKPAGLTVHPGAGFKGETLVSALLYNFKDIEVVGEEGRPGIVHRLDKDTSGVILVATSQEIYGYLKNAFLEHKVKKEYIALVSGKLEKMHGFIDTPIGRSKTDFRKYDTKDMVEAKESLTEYQVLEYLDLSSVGAQNTLSPARQAGGTLPQKGREVKRGHVDMATLLLVKLHTGRTHQIRVHMKSIGHPLMGDELYGGKKTILSGLSRQFLHARKVEVRLPDGTWIEAESELPRDLKEVLEELNSKIVQTL